jgi:purine-binding chemotaxis protein CheW
LLVFSLREHWFALPVNLVNKVVMLNNLYKMAPDLTTGLAFYQGTEIAVLDTYQRIFGQPFSSGSNGAEGAIAQPTYLLIVQNLQGEPIGLPLESQPSLRRIPESAFSPLPSTFLTEGHIRCATALILPTQNEPPIFLLNLVQLLQP